ncbi:hypothetical protein MZ018_14960 [Shewanella sp. JNE10-2]|uniref:hypothetical protein n=1 Tax=unclassified Shewanella TaxID=196818 RepID=UPI002004DD13|nr:MULTISPECIES: hypothetical protein [unclassified Shewanella]MCK7631074.1 hypothetical protein [Shewanella sp. JNE9-1]MCK7646327.1 hypothetical protein [Shewanella sp. JNE3-1]MCK7654282.1 hypothetical protein [Shewanella sp. JNE4-1]UPO26200.1 hypothetical protein MZ018_14960 [Shewanella sp. JNE10-2]UPO37186.1 hypothetical protein MZ097_09900 [Shewanella sp. JNE7]
MPFQRQPHALSLFVSPDLRATGEEDADGALLAPTILLPEDKTSIVFQHKHDLGDLDDALAPAFTTNKDSLVCDRGVSQPYNKGVSLLFFVLLVHVGLFLLIYILWRPQLNPFGLKEIESRGPKVAAIKAYFIYAPAVEKAETSEPETEIKAEDKIESANFVASIPIPAPQTPVKPQPNKTQSIAPSEEQPAEAIAKKPTNTLDITELKPQLGAKSSPAEEGESTIATSSSMSLFTQHYFERQREQALDNLVIEQADKFTRKSNMSEMSPEMEVLFVPNADDFAGTTSHDLPLDPNRIVRKGDTCYRVVQVGTQVNPYAQNLGFPFDCGGKKINQAIDDAIQSRLNKMMLKTHK